MEFAGEYILSKVLVLTEGIVRRALLKAGEQATTKLGKDSISDVIVAIEKETTQILDCLASQQQSKVDSAYQYLKFAMSDLQAWNEEAAINYSYQSSTSLNSQNSETVSYVSSAISSASSANFYNNSYTNINNDNILSSPPSTCSKYFRDAVWQLRQADEWATEAFNDKRNSKAFVRIEALHVRLFCRALLDWDNKRMWFAKWRQVLDPFFSDRQFVRYSMGEQRFTSRLFTDERAKPVFARFLYLTKCLEKLMWTMVLRDPSLAPHAREFALHFDKHTTLADDVAQKSLSPDWTGLRSFHLSYYDLNDETELKLCADRLVVRMYEFKSISEAGGGRVLAVEHEGRLVCFDAKDPLTRTMVTTAADEEPSEYGPSRTRWLSVAYASEKKKIYATTEDNNFVRVFNFGADDGKRQLLVEYERYDLPPAAGIPRHAYTFNLKVTPNGTVFLADKGSGNAFVRFPTDQKNDMATGEIPDIEMSSVRRAGRWLAVNTTTTGGGGEYDEIVEGTRNDQIIGMKLKGYYLVADVIDGSASATGANVDSAPLIARIVETIRERIPLLYEPLAYLMTSRRDEGSPLGSSRITIVCQTDKSNYIVSTGVEEAPDAKNGSAGVSALRIPIKDVCSFDTKYTDWKLARRLIEADGKLFILFV